MTTTGAAASDAVVTEIDSGVIINPWRHHRYYSFNSVFVWCRIVCRYRFCRHRKVPILLLATGNDGWSDLEVGKGKRCRSYNWEVLEVFVVIGAGEGGGVVVVLFAYD